MFVKLTDKFDNYLNKKLATRKGRRNFYSKGLLIGAILLFVYFKYLSSLIKDDLLNLIVTSLIFGILLVIILMSFVLLAFDYLSSNNHSKIQMSYSGLWDWVKSNDVGSATNIVKSLSYDENIKNFFSKELENINKDLIIKRDNIMLLDKNIYLVNSIEKIFNALDDATKNNMIFIRQYLELESSKYELWNNILKNVVGLAYIGILGTVFNFGINAFYSTERKILGQTIIFIAVFVSLISFILWIRAILITTREKNARNFLRFIFRIIDSKEEDNKKEAS